MKYLVLASRADIERAEEDLGKAYAASLGREWPITPDVVGPGRYPCGLSVPTPYAALRPEQRARVHVERYVVRALEARTQDGGGLLAITPTVEALRGDAGAVDEAELPARYRALLEQDVKAVAER